MIINMNNITANFNLNGCYFLIYTIIEDVDYSFIEYFIKADAKKKDAFIDINSLLSMGFGAIFFNNFYVRFYNFMKV